MLAPRLRHCITLQRRTATKDAVGQPLDTWETVAERRADVRLPSGLESIKADAPVSIVRASIRIRYMTGLDAGMRVLHGSATYNILAVLADPGRVFVDLVCEEVR